MVLLIVLGLVVGVIVAEFIETLVLRLLVVVFVAAALWALSHNVGLTRSTPENNTASSTELKKEEVKLQDVQISRTILGGYALSGNVANDSASRLTTISFRLTLKDCQDSNCRIVGQEDTTASVDVPPQQTRAFGSAAIRFSDLPALEPAKNRLWFYSLTSLRGGPDTGRPQQASVIGGLTAIFNR